METFMSLLAEPALWIMCIVISEIALLGLYQYRLGPRSEYTDKVRFRIIRTTLLVGLPFFMIAVLPFDKSDSMLRFALEYGFAACITVALVMSVYFYRKDMK